MKINFESDLKGHNLAAKFNVLNSLISLILKAENEEESSHMWVHEKGFSHRLLIVEF